MKRFIFSISLCAALAAQAQSDPFAAFAELEAEAAAEASKKEAGVLGKLAENLSGSVEVQGIHYFNDRTPAPGDQKNNFLNGIIDLETSTGGNRWKLGAAGRIQAGTQEDTFRDTSFSGGHFIQDLDEEEHRYLVLNELYLILNFNAWDLTLGKKTLPNGLSTLYSPADNLSPLSGYDPLTLYENGLWQIRADYYRNEYTWTFALLPIYQPNHVPPGSSRWINDTSTGPVPDADTEYPSKNMDNFGYFGRVKTTKNGWDLFASCYAGPGRQYVMEEQGTSLTPVAVRRLPDIINPAVGYSTTRGRWEFHGEAAFTDTVHGEDEDYVSFVQGTTCTIDGDRVKKLGLEQIEATAEVAAEWTTADQTANGYVEDSSSARIGQRDLIGRLRFKVSEELDVEYVGHIMFKRWGYLNRLTCNWEIMNSVTWSTGVEFFGGNEKSGGAGGLNNLAVSYGNWRQNNNLFTSLKYEF